MLPIEDVLARRNSYSKFGNAKGRLLPDVFPHVTPGFSIGRDDLVFTIGSCFARNIEKHLKNLGYDVPAALFTVPESEFFGEDTSSILNKYTPPAIFQEVEFNARHVEAGKESLSYEDVQGLFIEEDGRVIDGQLHGYVPVEIERAVERRNEIYRLYRALFAAKTVVITLGYIECWFDKKSNLFIQGLPTASMRKDTGRYFFVQMGYEACFDYVSKAIDIIRRLNPGVNILLTTSPISLNKTFSSDDVITANMFSKSILRAVSGEITRQRDYVDYFPSFESVMLTRRHDIFDADLSHVRSDFVGKIMAAVVRAYADAPIQEEGSSLFDLNILFDQGEHRRIVEEIAARRGPAELDVLFTGLKSAAALPDAEKLNLFGEQLIAADASAYKSFAGMKPMAEFLVSRTSTEDTDSLFGRLLAKWIAVGGDQGFFYKTRSAHLQAERNIPGALAAARQAVAFDPSNPHYKVVLGKLELRSGNLDEAERLARAASAIVARIPGPYLLLAAVQEKRGDFRGAIASCLAAREEAPDRGAILILLGRLHLRLKDHDEAERYTREAIEMGGGDEKSRRQLAEIEADRTAPPIGRKKPSRSNGLLRFAGKLLKRF